MSAMDSALRTAVDRVLDDCLAVAEGEQVVVVTDPSAREVAEPLVAGARERRAEGILIEMAARETHGTEPPACVATAMLGADVLICPTTKSLSHTEARHAACERGVRAATMPGITLDMLTRTMSADFSEVRRRSRAVAEALSSGRRVHITTTNGTEVTFSIEGRSGIADDGDLRSTGAFGNLPAGEGFIAPVEGQTNGRIVFDGTMWPVGKLTEPLVVEIVDGYATSFSGRDAAKVRALLEPYGKEAFAVAELGIGTNESAALTGNVLEDEKILGTIHVALGDNHSFGGTIRVPSHQDGIVLSPTVEVDGRRILDDGRFML